MKNPFKRNKQKDEAEGLPKTKAALAKMLIDDELLEMVAGGVSTNYDAYPHRERGDKSDIL